MTTPIRSAGIIGHGAFGSFARTLLERFVPGIELRTYSPNHQPDQEMFFSLEEACQCNAIILAVPIPAFEEVVRKVTALAPKTSVIVDVATVKVHTTGLLAEHASDRPYIATHPMFGPESYAKTDGDISGFRVVITGHTLPAETYSQLIEALRRIGFTIVETTPEEHDRQLAGSLFLTHFIAQVVSRAGFVRTEIDTVSFGFLMKAVEIVSYNTALFRDVFRFNPYCESVLKRFEEAEKETYAILHGDG
jgi:prephenate dehydrogenase